VSVDAKDDGRSPPEPAADARAPAGPPAVPAKVAPPAPPLIGAPPKATPPAPLLPPRPLGRPPKLVAPPPAAARPAAAAPVAAPVPVAATPRISSIPVPPPASEMPPPLEIPMPASPMSAAELDARVSRSTMEFLFELDAPLNPPSRELELNTMPEVEAALAASEPQATADPQPLAEPPEGRWSMPAESMPPPAADAGDDGIAVEVDLDPLASGAPKAIPRISLRAPPPANTAEEQLEARKRRLVARLLTCRDTFRALGFLEIKETDRKDVARLMMGLDDVLEPARKHLGIAKDPASVVASCTKDEIDRVERLISPIEDKLLALDDLVQDAMLAARVETGKISAKVLARYGRLLVSRRIQAGPRRDRFEWIATTLLSRKTKEGNRALVGPERAAQALELLVGGLPFKAKEQELEEAMVFLTDALDRLGKLRDQEAFFDSEFYIDVHGYKVSMREQLLSPSFVYLSVAINARLHNRMEQWIASMERVHNTNQLTQEGSPREQLTRRLREADDAVNSIFNVKLRTAPAPVARIDSKAPPQELKKTPSKRVPKKAAKLGIGMNRRLLALLVMLAIILGSGGYLAYRTGLVTLEERRDVPAKQLKQISPLIFRSFVTGAGKDQRFEGVMNRPVWRKMSPTERREEADRIAGALRKMGIDKGVVFAGNTKVIEINDGLVVNALYEGAP
jgi:hypothetical protein